MQKTQFKKKKFPNKKNVLNILREARRVNNLTVREKYFYNIILQKNKLLYSKNDTIKKLRMEKCRVTKRYKKNEKNKALQFAIEDYKEDTKRLCTMIHRNHNRLEVIKYIKQKFLFNKMRLKIAFHLYTIFFIK